MRDWRRGSRKQYEPDGRASPVDDLGSILEYTAQQIESGLTRIETANNWTLAVTLGAVIAVTNADSFPDPRIWV